MKISDDSASLAFELSMRMAVAENEDQQVSILMRAFDELRASGRPGFAEARRVMREAFEADMGPGGLWDAYVANVAMFLHDQLAITDHEKRNNFARDIMRMIFAK